MSSAPAPPSPSAYHRAAVAGAPEEASEAAAGKQTHLDAEKCAGSVSSGAAHRAPCAIILTTGVTLLGLAALAGAGSTGSRSRNRERHAAEERVRVRSAAMLASACGTLAGSGPNVGASRRTRRMGSLRRTAFRCRHTCTLSCGSSAGGFACKPDTLCSGPVAHRRRESRPSRLSDCTAELLWPRRRARRRRGLPPRVCRSPS